MDAPTSSKICGLIAGILSSDEDLHPHEAQFLQRMRTRFGLAKGTRIEPIVDHERARATLRGFTPEVRNETLDLLIEAAAADGKIAAAERIYLGVMADELALGQDELDDRLQQQLATSKPQPFGLASSLDGDD